MTRLPIELYICVICRWASSQSFSEILAWELQHFQLTIWSAVCFKVEIFSSYILKFRGAGCSGGKMDSFWKSSMARMVIVWVWTSLGALNCWNQGHTNTLHSTWMRMILHQIETIAILGADVRFGNIQGVFLLTGPAPKSSKCWGWQNPYQKSESGPIQQ